MQTRLKNEQTKITRILVSLAPFRISIAQWLFAHARPGACPPLVTPTDFPSPFISGINSGELMAVLVVHGSMCIRLQTYVQTMRYILGHQ